MEAKDELFFRLLRFASGTEHTCPKMHLNEWQAMFQLAKKQALTGFIGSSLNAISGNVLVETGQKSKDAFEYLIMQWAGEAMKIARRNKKVNEDVVGLFRILESQGFRCCLLKGQGNALMYPNPLSRTPGDIDVWVSYHDKYYSESDIRSIIHTIKTLNPQAKAVYHHIDAPAFNGTPVEVHYRPQFLFSYRHNKRLQRFFADHAAAQFAHKVELDGHEVAVPAVSFNVVFQLSHICQHLFNEGIGLRQIVDYFYTLKTYHREKADSVDWKKLLNRFGLYHIEGALTWILEEKLGMPQEWALAEPDERRGRFVLNEILQGGNFGKYDERNRRFGRSKTGRNVQRLFRDLRLVRYFPSEALSEPFFRLWHAVWRWRYN